MTWWIDLTQRPAGEVEFLLKVSEELSTLPGREYVTGIGYTPVRGWQPLITVDAEKLGIAPALRPQAPAEIHADLSWLRSGPFADIPDAFLLATGRAESLSGLSQKARLVGQMRSREFGSEGVRVVRVDGDNGWCPGFLTAGHVLPGGVATPVVAIPNQHVIRRIGEYVGRGWARRVGEVSLHQSPRTAAGGGQGGSFDFAVVDLDHVDADSWHATDFAAPLLPAPRIFENAQRLCVVGGVSGYTDHVSVTGALMVAEKRWRDCWVLGPSTALQKGDSGSVAYVYETGETFGMVVGSVAMMEETHHLYVQSLERLQAEELMPDVRISSRRSR